MDTLLLHHDLRKKGWENDCVISPIPLLSDHPAAIQLQPKLNLRVLTYPAESDVSSVTRSQKRFSWNLKERDGNARAVGLPVGL